MARRPQTFHKRLREQKQREKAQLKRQRREQRRLEKKESDLTSGSPVAENDATDGRPDENDTSPAANEPIQ